MGTPQYNMDSPDLNDLFFELLTDSWQPDLDRHRSPYVFRGLSSYDYELNSKLMRMGGNYWEREYHLLRSFRKYSDLNRDPSANSL